MAMVDISVRMPVQDHHPTNWLAEKFKAECRVHGGATIFPASSGHFRRLPRHPDADGTPMHNSRDRPLLMRFKNLNGSNRHERSLAPVKGCD
jgi:hypothetical protein